MSGKRVSIPRSRAREHLAKAEQFLEAGEAAAEAALHDAAMLNAIHAAISASDAVAIALAGVRSSDADHARAADLLEELAGGGSEIKVKARQLRQLLARKTAVEYGSRRATPKEARDALQRASRLVLWSRGVVTRAR